MRVLHVIDRFRRGGTERNVEHFICGEVERGREVDLAVLGHGGYEPDVPDSVSVYPLRRAGELTSPLAIARAVHDLRSLLIPGRYDIVHSHKSKAGVITRLAARRHVPAVVHTLHMASFGADAYGWAPSAAYLAAERACAHVTDVLVAVGEDIRALYLTACVGRPEQYVVVRSPVELDAFVRTREWSATRRAEIRRSLEVSADARLLLTVGLLEPRKRPSLILRAMAPLLARGEAVLAFVGEGPDETRLLALASELGLSRQLRFLGHVSDPAPFFAAADVLVHASRAEGIPQVLLQALAAGLPVVATDVQGLREIPNAPVTIVDRSGGGLLAAVSAPNDRPPVPVEALAPWQPDSIREQQGALHDHVDALVARRRGWGT